VLYNFNRLIDYVAEMYAGLQENIECDFEAVTSSPAPLVLMIDTPPPTAVRMCRHFFVAYAVVQCLSVHPSICLCVKFVLYIVTSEHILKLFYYLVVLSF